MLGIGCETCHASGQAHVRLEHSPLHEVPRALVSRAIVDPARLSRERQLDLCALCHGGAVPPKTAAFTYVPGTPLEQHLDESSARFAQEVDVHGNEVALLERSKCFRSSDMTCATCHDVHRTQRDPVALSGRRLTCHIAQQCGLYPQRGRALLGRCVDCHMPRLASNVIVSNYLGQQERPLVRTHWIKVYPAATSP